MQKFARADLDELVRKVLAQLPEKTAHATVVALSGDLGAGKTTFTQALAHVLGLEETIQSPTYVLMKSYKLLSGPFNNNRFNTLVHIDAYRLEHPQEFSMLKPEKFLNDPHTLVIIEWPERIEGVLPLPDLVLTFSSQDAEEGERYIGGI
jgi:tRNA threonylcarbamoyladenosine biosynthesis protein TsaE